MSRSVGLRLAGITVSGCIATAVLVPSLGFPAPAQTSEETAEPVPPAESSDADNGEPSPDNGEPSNREDGTVVPEDDTVSPEDTTPRFTCQMNNGRYTVMYSPQSQPDQAYPWAIPGDMGSNWPAQRRCNEISARLESYRPDGLSELQTAIENGYNTVCVTSESVPDCRLVFTVPEGQDPLATRNQVFENLTLADQGQQTQGVNTFVGGDSTVLDQIGIVLNPSPSSSTPTLGSNGINLKPFLAPEDGGTGTRLTDNSPDSRILNPDNFR